ncbi:hypothetical protein FA13DRAFT_1717159 [Coprinellus micaceus]|uniref:RING-type domain-containing protein n=1 Tax=Coprinellus micaceus TaxID=71717 RepID=A0A4Y7SHL7_COPMI|nr:hypothetical protein FA13DRAFT_1717159 [Coprinellus micaceus]
MEAVCHEVDWVEGRGSRVEEVLSGSWVMLTDDRGAEICESQSPNFFKLGYLSLAWASERYGTTGEGERAITHKDGVEYDEKIRHLEGRLGVVDGSEEGRRRNLHVYDERESGSTEDRGGRGGREDVKRIKVENGGWSHGTGPQKRRLPEASAPNCREKTAYTHTLPRFYDIENIATVWDEGSTIDRMVVHLGFLCANKKVHMTVHGIWDSKSARDSRNMKEERKGEKEDMCKPGEQKGTGDLEWAVEADGRCWRWHFCGCDRTWRLRIGSVTGEGNGVEIWKKRSVSRKNRAKKGAPWAPARTDRFYSYPKVCDLCGGHQPRRPPGFVPPAHYGLTAGDNTWPSFREVVVLVLSERDGVDEKGQGDDSHGPSITNHKQGTDDVGFEERLELGVFGEASMKVLGRKRLVNTRNASQSELTTCSQVPHPKMATQNASADPHNWVFSHERLEFDRHFASGMWKARCQPYDVLVDGIGGQWHDEEGGERKARRGTHHRAFDGTAHGPRNQSRPSTYEGAQAKGMSRKQRVKRKREKRILPGLGEGDGGSVEVAEQMARWVHVGNNVIEGKENGGSKGVIAVVGWTLFWYLDPGSVIHFTYLGFTWSSRQLKKITGLEGQLLRSPTEVVTGNDHGNCSQTGAESADQQFKESHTVEIMATHVLSTWTSQCDGSPAFDTDPELAHGINLDHSPPALRLNPDLAANMLPACGTCFQRLNPVSKAACCLPCGHILCCECFLQLGYDAIGCPLKCRDYYRSHQLSPVEMALSPLDSIDDSAAVLQTLRSADTSLKYWQTLCNALSDRVRCSFLHLALADQDVISLTEEIGQEALAHKSLLEDINSAQQALNTELQEDVVLDEHLTTLHRQWKGEEINWVQMKSAGNRAEVSVGSETHIWGRGVTQQKGGGKGGEAGLAKSGATTREPVKKRRPDGMKGRDSTGIRDGSEGRTIFLKANRTGGQKGRKKRRETEEVELQRGRRGRGGLSVKSAYRDPDSGMRASAKLVLGARKKERLTEPRAFASTSKKAQVISLEARRPEDMTVRSPGLELRYDPRGRQRAALLVQQVDLPPPREVPPPPRSKSRHLPPLPAG